jgi:hypothetical protein
MASSTGRMVQRSETMARSFGVQSQQLLAEGQIFEDEILSGTERTHETSQEMAERNEYGRYGM